MAMMAAAYGLTASLANGGTNEPAAAAGFVFRAWGTEAGLPQNTVSVILGTAAGTCGWERRPAWRASMASDSRRMDWPKDCRAYRCARFMRTTKGDYQSTCGGGFSLGFRTDGDFKWNTG